jgi:hypothetical protein
MADQLDVPAGQVIVSEDELRKVRDRLYRLEAAIEDVDADLGENPSLKEYQAAFDHLCDAARDLVGVVIEPVRQ